MFSSLLMRAVFGMGDKFLLAVAFVAIRITHGYDALKGVVEKFGGVYADLILDNLGYLAVVPVLIVIASVIFSRSSSTKFWLLIFVGGWLSTVGYTPKEFLGEYYYLLENVQEFVKKWSKIIADGVFGLRDK